MSRQANTVHDEPSDVCAVDGVVLVDGPNGVAVSFTPGAARLTSERLSTSADEAAAQQNASVGAQSASAAPYALVVDDDARILMTTCDILEEAGFRFFEAGSGDEAIPVLEANWQSISLLFTDVEMPGETDGFALARHVSAHWPAIEIVVVSGRVHPADGDLPQGATFIAKPFSTQIVHDHLRRILPEGQRPEPLRRGVE